MRSFKVTIEMLGLIFSGWREWRLEKTEVSEGIKPSIRISEYGDGRCRHKPNEDTDVFGFETMDTFMDGSQGATKGEGSERFQMLKLFSSFLKNVVRKMIDIDVKIGQVPCQTGGCISHTLSFRGAEWDRDRVEGGETCNPFEDPTRCLSSIGYGCHLSVAEYECI